MKKIRIPLDDLITVLEALRDSGGATEVIIFEYEGIPALVDADDPDNVITFQAIGEDGENDEDKLH